MHLYFWDEDCPLAKNNSILPEFKVEVEEIIKQGFSSVFHGTKFKIKFINKVFKNHRRYKFQLKLDL